LRFAFGGASVLGTEETRQQILDWASRNGTAALRADDRTSWLDKAKWQFANRTFFWVMRGWITFVVMPCLFGRETGETVRRSCRLARGPVEIDRPPRRPVTARIGSAILSPGADLTNRFVTSLLPMLVVANNALALRIGDRVLATSNINLRTAPPELALRVEGQTNKSLRAERQKPISTTTTKMKITTTLLALALVGLASATQTLADTKYVDQRYGPGGNGSTNAPYNTIQAAISDTRSSDVIVYPGTYQENLLVQKSIRIIGYDGPRKCSANPMWEEVQGAAQRTCRKCGCNG
jgi:hypothetical protein